MKHYHKNPRQITRKQFADLQDSLKRLGDLSGIVHDLTTDEVVGGNQRMDVFDIKQARIEIVERRDEPDDQGTVATGWVHWQGHRYSYRAVMWDDRTREEANIRANKAGGAWDMDILANQFEVPDLIEWGFMPYEIGIPGEGDDPNELWKGMPEFEQEDKTAFQSIHIHFSNQSDVDEFAELINQKITQKTRSIWYPQIEIERYADKRYSDEP